MRHRRTNRPPATIEQVPEPEQQAAPDLTARIVLACAGRTPAEIASMTDADLAAVIRYLDGIEPPADFVARLCRSLGVRASWMVLGELPMLEADHVDHLLKTSTPEQLRAAVVQAMAKVGPSVGPGERA